MIKHIVIFPIKSYSERVKGKNFLLLPDGRKLYQTTTMAALQSRVFTKVIVDTDSDEIAGWAFNRGIGVIQRLPELALNTANGNDLIRHHIDQFPGYDYYWQGFVTVPMISASTIREMVDELAKLARSGYDGLITCRKHKGFFWFHDQPVSFRPDVLPRSQDLPTVWQERSGFFGISYKGFLKTGCRYGSVPYFFEIPKEEDVEIDWPSDVNDLK